MLHQELTPAQFPIVSTAAFMSSAWHPSPLLFTLGKPFACVLWCAYLNTRSWHPPCVINIEPSDWRVRAPLLFTHLACSVLSELGKGVKQSIKRTTIEQMFWLLPKVFQLSILFLLEGPLEELTSWDLLKEASLPAIASTLLMYYGKIQTSQSSGSVLGKQTLVGSILECSGNFSWISYWLLIDIRILICVPFIL